MLTKRVIPCLDVKNGRVVKGINFLELKDVGDPVEQAKIYNEQGADELVFLDITASHEKRDTMIDVVRRTAEACFMPLTVGGGISTVQHVKELLRAGADKISVNTAAILNPNLIQESSKLFGAQCIVAAIDARDLRKNTKVLDEAHPIQLSWDWQPFAKDENTIWEVYVHGGRTPTGLDAIKWAEYVQDLGVGEILLTSMDCDGCKQGYDIEMTRAIAQATTIPVVASGGAGTLEHFYEAVSEGEASAVLAASLFHYNELSIKAVKEYLKSKGVEVRL